MHGRILGAVLAGATALLAALPGAALAGTANLGIPGASATNPLLAPASAMPWGVYKGGIDGTFSAYQGASGNNKSLLAEIALKPLAYWFGDWDPNSKATVDVETYIDKVQQGNPDALVQMAVFRLDPWEQTVCRSLPTRAEQASYKQWINDWAVGIGNTRVAMILQPDLPFEHCVPHGSTIPTQLVAYAAKVFSALPYTTVYVDSGASDWTNAAYSAKLLRSAGVKYARGFALGATHYTDTEDEIRYGQQVVDDLKADGVPNMHFVINTAQNGEGFTEQSYHGSDYDNAPVCATKHSTHCVTLGIPPTTDVSAPQWHLGKWAKVASQLVDAYLWFGRPWLVNQNAPFDLSRALKLAATTPFSVLPGSPY